MQNPEKPKIPTLNDIGTRFDHLMELKDAFEICIEIIKKKQYIDNIDAQKLIEFSICAKGIQVTIDSLSGYHSNETDFVLYKLINSVPKDPSMVDGDSGTPLK